MKKKTNKGTSYSNMLYTHHELSKYGYLSIKMIDSRLNYILIVFNLSSKLYIFKVKYTKRKITKKNRFQFFSAFLCKCSIASACTRNILNNAHLSNKIMNRNLNKIMGDVGAESEK